MKIALFDLDYTLLPLDSDHAWGEFTARIGWVDADEFRRRNDVYYAQYQNGTLDIHDYVRFATAATRQAGREQAGQARARFMREVIAPAILPPALALIEGHRAAGEPLAIVTATNEFVTRPIAGALGVPELIAVRLAVDADGWITGEIEGTPSFRAGKVARVGQWLAAQGLRWDDAEITFYSDSRNDLPLLEKAAHPVAVNPDPALREIARQRGWRILDLFG
ncbi:MAG: HAD-IB family hydrolase [Burkholderiaceae bacterium]|jgi:HAD superfamily hydrolase (TIGR01490 family)|nr:HAD-IB family hydrolase [Burkholderiaceae bacterium]